MKTRIQTGQGRQIDTHRSQRVDEVPGDLPLRHAFDDRYLSIPPG